MFLISLNRYYQKFLRRTNKRLICILAKIIWICLLTTVLIIFCRSIGILSSQVLFPRRFKVVEEKEIRSMHVVRRLKTYEIELPHDDGKGPLQDQAAVIPNSSAAISKLSFGRHGNRNALQRQELNKIQNINNKPLRRLPQAIIIGVKKCGTRALIEYLQIHPDIRAPGPEPHFFDRFYHLGLEWYRQKMPPTIEGQITVEKTPRYFVMPEVPARIAKLSKDIKLIIVVRDPVIRAISDFTQSLSKYPNITETFAEKAFHGNRSGTVNKNWSAIRTGLYIKHVKRWLSYFSIKQMHFVSGENLISNPAQEVQKVTDFLNLKRVITNKHFYFNETKGFPCLKKHERGSETKCFDRSKGRPHPHVDTTLIQKLKQFFKPYNKEFYRLVGQDFGWS